MISYFSSPIGILEIESSDNYLIRVDFVEDSLQSHNKDVSCPIIKETIHQLQEYFSGERKQFDLPIKMIGTDFRQKVWQALLTIPYGSTTSYKDIATIIGCPKGARAIGGANYNNPISIIIPCHRIIGKSGKLIGYNGGLYRKSFLLNLEKQHS
ncbi:MAG: methylated-DNA--[protein]-cysteine S-methyltransferase [Brevinema sp.]